MKFKKVLKRLGIISSLFIVGFALISVIIYFCVDVDITKYQQRSYIVYDKDKTTILGYTKAPGDYIRFKTTTEDVDPLYIKMLLSSEDDRFYDHPGVDFIAIFRAFLNNITLHKRQGASTIAMQVIKLNEKKERNYFNKYLEIIKAIKLTNTIGKDEILNYYLTLAPFGSNIESVNAASWALFNHSAKKLTVDEAALLVALPRSPEKMRPDKNYESAIYYRNAVLKRAYEKGIIKKDVYKAGVNREISKKYFSIPKIAPHIAALLIEKEQDKIKKLNKGSDTNNKAQEKTPNFNRELITTIDSKAQSVLNNTVKLFNSEKQDSNLEIAMVLLDSKTQELAGFIGSSSYLKTQFNVATAIRSPGSTLKPFLYAKAFDNNLIHKDSYIKDDRGIFNSYNPRNYSRTYQGYIKAQDALVQSLNLPCVYLIQNIGVNNFLDTINTDFSNKKRIILKDDTSSLALILGGVGISLYDLTTLYSTLNNDGLLYDFKTLKIAEDTQNSSNKDVKPLRLFEKESARAVFEILKYTIPPSGYAIGKVSYKTGTSYNFTDALSLGSLGQYTLGVSVLKLDNSTINQNAYTLAAPYLFYALNHLKISKLSKEILQETKALSKEVPKNLKIVNIDEKGRAIHQKEDTFSITYPLDGSDIMTDENGYIFLNIKGGNSPFTILIDDNKVVSEPYFKAEHEGFTKISVIDNKANLISINVNIKMQSSNLAKD